MTLFDLQPSASSANRHETALPVPTRTALEIDFPAVELSRVAEHESWRKEVHRPATSTHKWWAKRLGTIFRGIVTAALTEDRMTAMQAYSSPTAFPGLLIFDPFAGSGTTVVEAAKLGADAVGWDINPVATLVQRQALQPWDMSKLRTAYRSVEERCREQIDRVHRTEEGETVLYYFWVAVGICPACAERIRLFSTHVFAKHAYPRKYPTAKVVCPACLDILSERYDFDRTTCRRGHSVTQKGTVDRDTVTCTCGQASKVVDTLDGGPPQYEMYSKLVLGFNGSKRYDPITEFDNSLYKQCGNLLARNTARLVLPTGELTDGYNTRQAIRWGFRSWHQFFNDRQLYSLGLLAAAVRDVAAGQPEREALIALFSGALEFNNMFCSFKGEGTGAVRHMFSHHILKPERTPLEAHPWGTPASSGSFSTLFDSRLIRAHRYKEAPTDLILVNGGVKRLSGLSSPLRARVVSDWAARGEGFGSAYLRTGDSARTDLPDQSVDLIITDPPYMDNVHYSELADFFHAWLRGMTPFSRYPTHQSTRRGGEVQSTSAEGFQEAIGKVWRECARVLKAGGLIAFTFHQARLSGWIAIMRSLADAGFVVTAVQPVKGEMTTSVTKVGTEPSNLDAVVVCRRRTDCGSTSSDVRQAAKTAIQRLADLKNAGVAVGPGDVRSVVRGQVLATYTSAPTSTPIDILAYLADEYVSEFLAEGVVASATSIANLSQEVS
jgi:adenine-specific DNA methylase